MHTGRRALARGRARRTHHGGVTDWEDTVQSTRVRSTSQQWPSSSCPVMAQSNAEWVPSQG
jgi:hypothetical protein